MRRLLSLIAAAGVLGLAGAARADSCEAVARTGPVPAYLEFGATFSGTVAVVIDGDSLCVAVGEGRANLVEVRLADFFAPELSEPGGAAAKAALEKVALGRRADCVANLRTYDRIAARCRIDGQAVGDLMRLAGVSEGGRGQAAGARTQPGRARAPLARAAASASAPMVVESGGGAATRGGGMYRSCAEARAAGAAPMRIGAPGYNPRLDGDHDGIACEPIRERR